MKLRKTSSGAKRKSVAKKKRSRTTVRRAPVARAGKTATAKRKAMKRKIAKRKVVRRKTSAPKFPPILLEGDHPAVPPASVQAEKFALGPTAPDQHFAAQAAELPQAYGTKRLFLTARDPHWLYAHWDFTHVQQTRFNKLSADKHLVLRVHSDAVKGAPVSEIHVHPESHHWFVHVERPDTHYVAEIGYYRQHHSGRSWTRVVTSKPALTPPDSVSADRAVEFATIPLEVPFEKLVAMVKQAAREHLPLAKALQQLRKSEHLRLPATTAIPASSWTPEQERALAEVISVDRARRVWVGSLEITELLRRELEHEISSIAAAQFGLPAGVSSPFGGGPAGEKGFWFNVNAELIIYGATEPDAKVSIAGQPVKLRPDGSFNFRFALPDGQYELPVVAVSSDETDGRGAELKFTRSTEFRGDVGAHPQDPTLNPPTPDNV
jgi:uncharacterized protein